MQPWQVFQAARKYIGADVVAKIFNREKRSAYNWGQDPAYTECRCKSPLELLHTLFERMDAVGIGYVARAAIRYLETALDSDVDPGDLREPLADIDQEILADFRAVAELQRCIEQGCNADEVRSFAVAAKDEIDRTIARYIKDHE